MSYRSWKSLFLFVIFVTAPLPDAAAQSVPPPAPPVIGARSYVLIDSDTGQELASLDADTRLAPASLTKLMTAYAIFSALDDSQVGLADQVTISENAWRTPGSRMFIEVGSRVSVQDLLRGMIVQSGNDSSVALAEHVAGTELVFAEVMNRYAAALGMRSSHFMNATGLPHDRHYSTARDLARVARAIIREFPDYYRMYSEKEFEYNRIVQPNRNSLLWRDSSVDGMKTGFTDDAGYCLVSSAKRDGMRIISVVLGTSSAKARTNGSQALLNYGFRFFETRLLFRAGETITQARTWKAASEFTDLGLEKDVYITVPRGSYNSLESVLNIPAVVLAPLAEGQPVAELQISLNGSQLLREPLRALQENPSGSLWVRARDGVQLWLE
ncbi:MAG TPA: D-alanyl-D-alanine carboxypeptidase family protein [Woeseiaceae bacterium]|jgi:D-alanyl-D-alanine carboxypeptidase (penicillin-binding protein 5/6)